METAASGCACQRPSTTTWQHEMKRASSFCQVCVHRAGATWRQQSTRADALALTMQSCRYDMAPAGSAIAHGRSPASRRQHPTCSQTCRCRRLFALVGVPGSASFERFIRRRAFTRRRFSFSFPALSAVTCASFMESARERARERESDKERASTRRGNARVTETRPLALMRAT